jgi:hypothetical protein
MPPKGPNRVAPLKTLLRQIGVAKVAEVLYEMQSPQLLEDLLPARLELSGFDEVVVDISALTKLAILLVLCCLRKFEGTVRVVYAEAEQYCPSKAEYHPVKREMAVTARFPSRGAEQTVRLRCLSSIRMQGQPLTVVAFTSFNEKLVSHMLGVMSPHRLLFINGRPPHRKDRWREYATQDIHRRLCNEYDNDNPTDLKGLLSRVASTLDYRDSVKQLERIYREVGLFERIICAATGSKMQTVGLFIAKVMHPEIQIEYPTPDSYFFRDMTHGIRDVHEVVFPNFSEFVSRLRRQGGGYVAAGFPPESQ